MLAARSWHPGYLTTREVGGGRRKEACSGSLEETHLDPAVDGNLAVASAWKLSEGRQNYCLHAQ